MRKIVILFLSIFILVQSTKAYGTELIGAGATFPYPFLSQVFNIYHRETGTRVNYQAIGSGGGVNQIINRTVDFAGTDAYLTETQLQQAEKNVLHIPIILGAVVVSYNLPENPQLNLTGEILADIYLGNITRWDDDRIKELNPDQSLPALPILAAYRSDGSGTTFIFSDYLCKVSSEWEKEVGKGTSLRWQTGLGGRGNPGVAGLLTEIPGTIGYLERNYANQSNLPVASLKNKAGHFVAPTTHSISQAAEVDLPPHNRVSITNSEAKEAYPICGFTWIIVYEEQKYGRRTPERAQTLAQLLEWLIKHAQEYAVSLDYSPLPPSARENALNLIYSMTYDGKTLIEGTPNHNP